MFQLSPSPLGTGQLDRSEDIRSEQNALRHWADALVVPVVPQGLLPLESRAAQPSLLFLPAADLGAMPPPGAILLGAVAGQYYWAVATDDEFTHVRVDARTQWLNLRLLGPLLPAIDAALATTAIALIQWHQRARFCTQCGQAMAADVTGKLRRCPTGHEEFPRMDPAVIVLVHDGVGNVILGRSPQWDPGRYSVLAGFTEAGETLENTVVREVHEEVGVAVSDVHYLGSQPWPFPRSLMISFAAQAAPGAILRPRRQEIADARWFSRQELAAILAQPPARPSDKRITLPGPLSIARHMLEAFVAGS